jgi:hypothetical protein
VHIFSLFAPLSLQASTYSKGGRGAISSCKDTRYEGVYNLHVNLGTHQRKACVYWTAWCMVAELPRAGVGLSISNVSVTVD